MSSTIVLVRHGPSAHVHSGGLADRSADATAFPDMGDDDSCGLGISDPHRNRCVGCRQGSRESSGDVAFGDRHTGFHALVVTHGVFRRLLAKELIAQGWAGVVRRGGYRPWSFWLFSSEPRRLA